MTTTNLFINFRIVLFVSFIEVYNEQIYDLLRPLRKGKARPSLRLAEDRSRPFVKNLQEIQVSNQIPKISQEIISLKKRLAFFPKSFHIIYIFLIFKSIFIIILLAFYTFNFIKLFFVFMRMSWKHDFCLFIRSRSIQELKFSSFLKLEKTIYMWLKRSWIIIQAEGIYAFVLNHVFVFNWLIDYFTVIVSLRSKWSL